MTKLGIFGGTFDPIHEGHLALARAAKNQFGLHKILFVPALIPPHKSGRHDLTPAPYRYRMVELAILKEPAFEISQIELERPEVSYTADTLRELEKEYPKNEFYLIVGADSLPQIPTWKESDEILKRAHILVAPRPGFKFKNPFKDRITEIKMEMSPIASSKIRNAIRESKPIPKNILAPEVEKYVREMHLYEGGPA